MQAGRDLARLFVAPALALLVGLANASSLVPRHPQITGVVTLSASARQGDIKGSGRAVRLEGSGSSRAGERKAVARSGPQARRRPTPKPEHRTKRAKSSPLDFALVRKPKKKHGGCRSHRPGRGGPKVAHRRNHKRHRAHRKPEHDRSHQKHARHRGHGKHGQRERRKKVRNPAGRPAALPIPKDCVSRNDIDDPHHDYPAWDVPVPRRIPVRAVRAGVVIDRTRSGGCGRGIIIRGVDGYIYTYCHGSKVLRRRGKRVEAGQVIMRTGNTGNSTGPHLHLQVRGPRGGLVCPQRLVRAAYSEKELATWETRTRGCVGR